MKINFTSSLKIEQKLPTSEKQFLVGIETHMDVVAYKSRYYESNIFSVIENIRLKV